MDHPPNARLKAGLEQVPGAHRVDLHGRRIVCGDRAIDAPKMHDHFDIVQPRAQRVEVTQIGLMAFAGRADVEDAHSVLRQFAHDVSAKSPQATGHRDTHARTSSWP